jgi:hypothetical protein
MDWLIAALAQEIEFAKPKDWIAASLELETETEIRTVDPRDC